jgi:hypothetical protein
LEALQRCTDLPCDNNKESEIQAGKPEEKSNRTVKVGPKLGDISGLVILLEETVGSLGTEITPLLLSEKVTAEMQRELFGMLTLVQKENSERELERDAYFLETNEEKTLGIKSFTKQSAARRFKCG